MAALIGLVSQKGDVNKGTLARLMAREYSEAGWHVKIVDLHISQAINTNLEAMARACRYQARHRG